MILLNIQDCALSSALFAMLASTALAQPGWVQPEPARSDIPTLKAGQAPGIGRDLADAIDGLQRAVAFGGLPLASEHAAELVERATAASLDGARLVQAALDLAEAAFKMADPNAVLRWLASARGRLDALQANPLLRLRLASLDLRAVAEAGKMADAYAARLQLRDQLFESGLANTETAIENEIFITGLLIELGRSHEAIEALGSLARQVSAHFNAHVAIKYDIDANLVLAFAQGGHFEDARQLARRNLETIRTSFGERGFLFARQAALLSLVEIHAGDPAAARPAAELALLRTADEFGESAFLTIRALELLTFVVARLARTEEAITTQQRLVDSLKARLGDEHPRTLLARGNLAVWQLAEGSLSEALPTLRVIAERTAANEGPDGNNAIGAELDYIEALSGDGQIDVACSRVDALHKRLLPGPRRTEATYRLAQCWIDRGRLAEARRALADVIGARSSEGRANYGGVVDALGALARLELAAGDETAALQALERLYQLVEAERLKDSPAPGSGRALFARRVADRAQFAGYRDLSALYARTGRAADAIRVAEQARGRALNDALSTQRYASDVSLPQGVRLRLREADLLVRSLDGKLALASAGSLEAVRLSQSRDAAAAQRDMIAQTLAHSAVRPGEEAKARLHALRRDEAVVGFQWAPNHAWAYLLRKDAGPEVVLLDLPSSTLSAIAALRARLVTPSRRLPIWRKRSGEYVLSLSAPEANAGSVDTHTLLGELHAALLAPLLKKLAGARRLIFIADGPLAGFPFEVLERNARPVGLDFEVRYAASLAAYRHASWLSQRPAFRTSRTLLAIGAPNYATLGEAGPAALRGRRWTELPGAAAEIASIAAQFPPAKRTVLLGPEATREQFLRMLSRGALSGGGFLHVAAHAYLSAGAPQWSSLVLGSATRTGPGYVTAAELAAYNIDAELVTLSACETALGREIAGEGLFGLPYALAVAGSRATVLTLWSVADEGTAAFMKRFYAKLARGDRPAAALAKTKREFMRHPRWGDPFFWAPFVLYGAG
jgi:CHAT domain-containing protein